MPESEPNQEYSVFLPPSLLNSLEDYARDLDTSPSDLVRELLKQGLHSIEIQAHGFEPRLLNPGTHEMILTIAQALNRSCPEIMNAMAAEVLLKALR